MKCLIVGCGQMGTAVAYAMSKLGYTVHLQDRSEPKEAAIEKLRRFGIEAHPFYHPFSLGGHGLPKFDVVISAATFTANKEVAVAAISNNIPYCDLGGDPETSAYIQEFSNMDDGEVFTDLGLAPGLVNIIAEHMVARKSSKVGDIKKVIMRVGGLPVERYTNVLNYKLTWSPEGLYNEYVGNCKILLNGVEKEVPALYGPHTFVFGNDDVYGDDEFMEAFCTKGAIANSIPTMRKYGVDTCIYTTIRYPGHHSWIDFMINQCEMDQKNFSKAIKKCCGETKEDIVYIQVEYDNRRWFRTILHDEYWTAMQKATAFPAAAVAALLAEKRMPNKRVYSYLDIPLVQFNEKLTKIGGFPEIKI
jgi:saccharopine dehydrogenase-like NADP-dependent oxidoreductase